MPSNPLSQSLQRLWASDKFSYSFRVFTALGSIMLLCITQNWMNVLIPLFLGVIACALAESGDSWKGRLLAVLVTLTCFTLATYAVELLFPYPWLFVISLAASSFALTMLGSLGERYASMGWGTLILSVYSMLVMESQGDNADIWHQPLILVAGAAWYGLLSILWNWLFSNQPVQQSLARLFRELGRFLKLKAALFEPLRNINIEERRLALAHQNGRVVAALNNAKDVILHRVGNSRATPAVSRYLKLYFLAQDIHERASSSHYPYNEMAEAFYHSDVLFRCQRLLQLHGDDCQRLARAIETHEPFVHQESSHQALGDLHDACDHLRSQNNPAWRQLLRSLSALATNMHKVNLLLNNASNPDALAEEQDSSLYDREPQTLREVIRQLRSQLTPTSLVFRHALRLSIALAVGYGLVKFIDQSQGYWILLTTLFVCQPNYGATRLKLFQRVGGTVLGLILGWMMFNLMPNMLMQAAFAVLAGVGFFTLRGSRYTLATASITLLVLFCFNQIGEGYDVFVPRLLDTLLGSLIAALAVIVILPDWQGRRLNQLLANTLSCNSRYLNQIIEQYTHGKRDDLIYRVARRNAHNADATLSTTLGNMLKEPGHFRKDADLGFRFLLVSHTLLSYLSALGAHRGETDLNESHQQLLASASNMADSLDEIATCLHEDRPIEVHSEAEQKLANELALISDDADDTQRLLQTQLALICRQLGPLRTLAGHLLKDKRETGAAN
ncbi:YccS family putative transporter [Ectopseudomonas mendocina]|uniref:YccS family putative transporter n=1 Tax=Ectopseudomonas mendocina TaxID=300 RepID=A0ABZ2RMF7_ECTME